MNKLFDWLPEDGNKVIAGQAIAIIAILGGVIAFSSDDNTTLRDGVTFEQDGTALAGRKSAEGWVDLECEEIGRVVVTIMKPNLEEVGQGSFKSSACDDGVITPGELSLDEIPKGLRG